MSIYKRKTIKKLTPEYSTAIVNGLLNAHQIGYPLSAILDTAGIEFPELFCNNDVFVCYDITFGGAEQLSIHNGHDSLLIIRRTGIIMLTYNNLIAIQQYIGRGRFKILTDEGLLKTMWIDSKTLEPQYK